MIQTRAKTAGMSVSAYLRSAGIGSPPRADRALHHEQVLALAKVNADQGRLGNLLKLWLDTAPGRAVSEREVRKLFDQVRNAQWRLAEVLEGLR